MEASDLFERARGNTGSCGAWGASKGSLLGFDSRAPLSRGEFCVSRNLQDSGNGIFARRNAGDDSPTAVFSVCPLIARICE